ncbi:hypothetical protein [Auritidibacter ignavus]|uniref:hypothetical protein n=1 Tax=Auritidibacter ignavus TaxID=678932 RepID=UPI0024BA881A|nr:hypothetical protein [Auritidibacter ignavus]WHS27357.1 hypothetical protein QM395_08195 [Auritidibacter ignavus]
MVSITSLFSSGSIPGDPLGDQDDLFAEVAHRPTPVIVDYATSATPDPGPDSSANSETVRTELSGTVVMNWVHKVANLLSATGCDDPHHTCVIDLPVDWLTTCLVFGALFHQRHVTLAYPAPNDHGVLGESTETGDQPDLVITDRPQRWLDTSAEIFVVGASADEDPSLISVDQEVLAQPDQPTYPPQNILSAWQPPMDPVALSRELSQAGLSSRVELVTGGVLIATDGLRYSRQLVEAILHTWSHHRVVVLLGLSSLQAPEEQRLVNQILAEQRLSR